MNETTLSALESARLEPPEFEEEFEDIEPDWETLAEEREEMRETREEQW